MKGQTNLVTFIKSLALILLSVGWLAPLYLAGSFYFGWLNVEIEARLYHKYQFESFPYLHFTAEMFGYAILWLAVAIVVWTILILNHLRKMENLSSVV